jgi:aspartate racemase
MFLYSVDFEEIEKLQNEGKWDELSKLMITAAQKLENAGAEFIVICSNTMHKLADEIQENIDIPVLHIVDAVADEIKRKGINTVGLLGTKFTMEEGFYKDKLKEKYGIEVLIPDESKREIVHDVIYTELCKGAIEFSSKEKFMDIIKNLADRGAEGVILGCTEIPLLVKDNDVDIPIFDTTTIHAKSAVEYALKMETLSDQIDFGK